MSLSTLAFSVTVSVMAFAAPPEAAPAPAPAPAPVANPQPAPVADPQPYYAPQPGYQDPYAPQPAYQDPYAAPAPTPAPAYVAPEQTGVGMLVTGPILVALGVPFSFLGNAAWRENCGPLDSTSACAGGTAAGVSAHTVGVIGHDQEIQRTGQLDRLPTRGGDLGALGEHVGVARRQARAERTGVHRERRVQVRVAEVRAGRERPAHVRRVGRLRRTRLGGRGRTPRGTRQREGQ
jgi:hypothetical protein